MTQPTAIVRSTDWIEREYGRQKWPAILSRIDAELAAGETDLARVLSAVKRWEIGSADDRDLSVVVAGRELSLPRSFALHGGIGLILEKLVARAAGADVIIELGSGWGFNLFHLWLNGGPRSARYLALEYTQAGRQCTERLADLKREFDITAMPFDYYAVDLNPLGCFAGRVFVFSCFSIDQIPQLPSSIFLALRKLSGRVDGIHFEPAGWQMQGDRCVGSSQRYAERHDYNRNLWSLLNELQGNGLLRIEACHASLFGQNSQNSAAMLSWSMGA